MGPDGRGKVSQLPQSTCGINILFQSGHSPTLWKVNETLKCTIGTICFLACEFRNGPTQKQQPSPRKGKDMLEPCLKDRRKGLLG